MNLTTATPLPGPRRPLATIRLMRGLVSEPCPALDTAASRFGATFALGFGRARIVVVGDPAHLRELFTAPTESFRWGHALNVLRFFVGNGSMIVSDGDDHRRRRGHVQPGFARRHLDGWAPMIVAETDRSIERDLLNRHEVVDLYPIGRDLALRVVVGVLFGAGLDERVEEIGRLLEPVKAYLEQTAIRQVPHPLPFTKRSRAAQARRRLDQIIDEEIARRAAQPGRRDADLLDTLLHPGGDDRLSESEIKDQVVTLIGAGYDTTASSIGWTILRAAADPDVWQRLRDEADGALGPPGAELASGPPSLPFARAVVHEALRLHPAGVFSPRQAVADVRVGPHTIPRGAMILWSPYLAGRDAGTWDDPLEFRPERHLAPDDAAAAAMAAAWVPFGKGPRRCIGFALAELELTLVLARLAQRVTLVPETVAIPRPYGMVVNRPAGGVRMRVLDRG
jgi:cytochrome P450